MFYNYKNLPVSINGLSTVCSDVTINLANDISAVYRIGDRSTNDYAPGGATIGTLDFSYYLTGADHIKSYISNDTIYLSGNVGGWYFNSGKLKSYNVRGVPNEPVSARVSIAFFDPLKGSIGSQVPVVNNYPSLNFCDVTLDPLNNYTVNPISNILSFDFGYSANLQPIYLIDENLNQTSILPSKVCINEKAIACEITSDNIEPDLSIYGERAGLILNFNHPNLPDLTESLMCSGFLTQKNFKSSVGENLITQLSVIQHHTNNPPYINSFTPSTANVGDIVTINGRNLSAVIDVYVYANNPTYRAAGITVIDDQTLTFSVTEACRTGPIFLRSLWGNAQSDTQLTVTYGTINIRSSSSAGNTPGELIYIEGDNIQNITDVTFGGTSATYFSHMGNTGLLVQIPPNAVSGPIAIGSRQTLKTGTSAFHFIVPPTISGFTPASGVYGNTVTISGRNFTGVSGVLFNTVPAPYTLVNNLKITATVPSGWTHGPITVSGASGYNAVSSGVFQPLLPIVGISPTSGFPFAAVRITGTNFDTGMMYPFPSGGWQVGFNGFTTGFTRVNNTLLTGLVPSGDTSGPIFVYKIDGSTFESAFSWQRIYYPNAVYNTPTGIYSGQMLNMSVTGEGLFSINAVSFTGTSPTITIGSQYYNSDKVGHQLTITGFSTIGRATGVYDLVVANSVGTSVKTGALTIQGQINRCREFYVRAYSSSTGTTGNPYPFVYRPEYAIDGKTSNSGVFALTTYESGAWWEVKLLRSYPIQRIVVYPYATGTIALLTNFSGILYDSRRTGVWNTFVTTPSLPSHTFSLTGTTGLYFRIAKMGSGFVGLGEVEIY